jgi:DNA modification methylase
MIDLRLGDCLEILPTIEAGSVTAVVTDPPYGMRTNTNSRRFSGGVYGEKRYGGNGDRGMGREWDLIQGDDQPFDPSRWLEFPKVIMWGSNHYAASLPVGTSLVWIKKSDDLFGTFLSDAEIGWMKGGHGVYCFRKEFPPPSRMYENHGKVAHPTQKPVKLMLWCFKKLKLKEGDTVLDPYAGSGTTAIACIRAGLNFIGCEIHEPYFLVAQKRIAAEQAKMSLFAGLEV